MRVGFVGCCVVFLGLLLPGSTLSAQSCPQTVKGKNILSRNCSASSTKPGCYALDSAIINTGNGQVVGSAPYAT